MTVTTIEQIATDLRVGFETDSWPEVLIPILADVVDVEHHPTRGETDGPTPAGVLAANMRAADHHGVLTDARQTLLDLTVEGDVIEVELQFEATIVASGETMSTPLTERFTFRDGRLVAIDHYTDPAVTDRLLQGRAG